MRHPSLSSRLVRAVASTVPVVSVIALGLLGPGLAAQAKYEFVLDGETMPTFSIALMRSPVVSLRGTPDEPVEGDLLWVTAKKLCLVQIGPPGRYEFFDEFATNGRLRMQSPGGESIAVLDSKQLVVADAAVRRQLRGAIVEHWDDVVAKAVAELDPSAPLVLVDSAACGDTRALPPLPDPTRHLALLYNSAEGFRDLSSARALGELRSLHIAGNHYGFTEVDLRAFEHAHKLRHFEWQQREIANPDAIANFHELRSLSVRNFPLATFAWLGAMSELRFVEISGPNESEPRSLAPLRNLPRLAIVELTRTAINELPADGFPALRKLSLRGCGVPVVQEQAFVAAHRSCEFHGAPDDRSLQSVLATADRCVLRTGGTCHRRPAHERVLFDTGDKDELAKARDLVHVVEDSDSFHCNCCGTPTLEFHAAGKLIATIGVHHGHSLRWSDGPWTSDAQLTTQSAEALVQWLAAHGDPNPLQERQEMRNRAQERARRTQLRAAMLGVTVTEDADLDDVAAECQRAAEAPAADGGLRQLRVLGCHEGAWYAMDEFDRALLGVAGAALANAETCTNTLARCGEDDRAALGLAAVWVDEKARELLSAEQRLAALPIAARAALRSPQPKNRARMLQHLRDDASDAARDVLLAALDGRFEPRQVAPEQLVAPGGMVRIDPSDSVLDAAGASNQALAALCLAALRCTAALPRIEALAKTAADRDAKLLQRAADALAAGK